jgi:hypothetical protein
MLLKERAPRRSNPKNNSSNDVQYVAQQIKLDEEKSNETMPHYTLKFQIAF